VSGHIHSASRRCDGGFVLVFLAILDEKTSVGSS
jgi:hypothetical protein